MSQGRSQRAQRTAHSEQIQEIVTLRLAALRSALSPLPHEGSSKLGLPSEPQGLWTGGRTWIL